MPRFTDQWPPVELLENHNNWAFAYSEGRSGEDETTIKPHRQQSCIDEEVVYTAADVWFPEDDSCLALLEVRSEMPVGLFVFEGAVPWSIVFDRNDGTWAVSDQGCSITMRDGDRFPIRVMTRLPLGYRGDPIRFQVSQAGFATDW